MWGVAFMDLEKVNDTIDQILCGMCNCTEFEENWYKLCRDFMLIVKQVGVAFSNVVMLVYQWHHPKYKPLADAGLRRLCDVTVVRGSHGHFGGEMVWFEINSLLFADDNADGGFKRKTL